MDDRTPSWGIDPVPERFRTLGLLDQLTLWGNLGVSLLVLVIGALLVPALTLRDALLAILVGGLIGNAMVGAAGLIGADARVPSMVLLRAPLGRRGSYVPTALNALQCLGWATFELIIIAAAASALSDELFGFEAKVAWTIFFGMHRRRLRAARAGRVRSPHPPPIRRLGRPRFARLPDLVGPVRSRPPRPLGRPGRGRLSFWLGVDLVIAITVSWVPARRPTTRASPATGGQRSGAPGAATSSAGPGCWRSASSSSSSRGISDPVEIPPAVAAAGLAAALALLAVTLDETDEAFANVYSAAVSLQNVFSQRRAARAIVIAAMGARDGRRASVELRNYESFLLLLGSCFVPLFGVLLADWLRSGARYTRMQIFDAPAWRAEMLLAWIVGFALYHWLHEPPLGPSWWVDIVEETGQPNLGIGASLPSFAASFALALGLSSLGSRLPQPVSKW